MITVLLILLLIALFKKSKSKPTEENKEKTNEENKEKNKIDDLEFDEINDILDED